MPDRKYVVVGSKRLKDVNLNDCYPGDVIEPDPAYVEMLIEAGHIALSDGKAVEAVEEGA